MAENGPNPSVQGERVNTEIITLTRFLTKQQAQHKDATTDFTIHYVRCLSAVGYHLEMQQCQRGFTMDNALGEFILTHPNMKVPRNGAIYSVNEGNSLYWEEPVKQYFNGLKYAAEEGENPYSARYIGSMVADAYRTLLYGGIFAYPADKKSPKGKLRILYECAPMAMVFENAGGQAVDSKMKRMMEIVPEHIHDRSGIFMGSYDEVQRVIDLFVKSA
ncbi:hypothetical protein V501_03795 [Pseudogymnoascus sp. VKM F-4519 (FW-2642)]|nr:hypothetical protein V501_03795 [Pseudogymnoascus sp. VKM F-4519 (FW-2642)]